MGEEKSRKELSFRVFLRIETGFETFSNEVLLLIS